MRQDVDVLGARVHVIKPEEHCHLQTANMGYGYHSLIWMFAHPDDVTLLVEVPEPLRMVQIACTRGAVPKIKDVRIDGRGILYKGEVETRAIDDALRAGSVKTRRGKVWEIDARVAGPGLLVVTLG